MERRIVKSVLLNEPAAADADNANDMYTVKGLMPINKIDFIGLKKVTAVAETKQVTAVGKTTQPTIAAGTLYKIRFGTITRRIDGYIQDLKPYAHKSAAVLSGNAGNDRHNVYVALAEKINNDKSAQADAYPVSTVTYNTQTANFTVGKTLTGATSGAKGIILADVDAGLTGTLTLAMIGSKVFASAEIIADDNSTPGSATSDVITNGVYLRLVDKGTYYKFSQTTKGANALVAAAGFTSAHVEVVTAAVYSEGQGSRLAELVPVQEKTSANLASGDIDFPVNEAPTSGKGYTKWTLKSKVPSSSSALSPQGGYTEIWQNIYARDDASGYAAFAAEIDAFVVL